MQRIELNRIESLALAALINSGTAPRNATPLAKATRITEAQGIASHGLAYVPVYCQHVQCGKVDGNAEPQISVLRTSAFRVDAANGFAHPAIQLGFEQLIPAARENGIALLNIYRSYNCGVLGVHTGALADAGLIGFGTTNAPASIAPSGGKQAVVGTNPWSFALPGSSGFLIDQSASVIAKSEIMKAKRESRTIPDTWALDSNGQPTNDPEIALTGSMAPSGGYKGVNQALMVELLAAALSGANLGTQASPFSGTIGGPPGTGQCFIAIDPEINEGFVQQVKYFCASITDQGARLPGLNRRDRMRQAEIDGVSVNPDILRAVTSLAVHD
jgi:(2R)-3-sulfolactate dehydrogenase (NADP+)